MIGNLVLVLRIKKERYFKIKAYINNKSVLVFGLDGDIAETFEIGKLLSKFSEN
jgi:hypothetical protein